jgi:excisionase family DNA binding protein
MADNVTPFRPRATPAGSRDTDQAATTEPAPLGRMVYTVKETAQLLSLSLGTTYQLIRSGDIPAIKLGGRWVVPKRRLHEWVNNLPTTEPTEPSTEPSTERERQELAAVRQAGQNGKTAS